MLGASTENAPYSAASHSGNSADTTALHLNCFLDVLTGPAITTKIAACCMYMCLLPVLEDSLGLTRKSNLRENPKQNGFTTMLAQSQG